jgi:hypothetical protein
MDRGFALLDPLLSGPALVVCGLRPIAVSSVGRDHEGHQKEFRAASIRARRIVGGSAHGVNKYRVVACPYWVPFAHADDDHETGAVDARGRTRCARSPCGPRRFARRTRAQFTEPAGSSPAGGCGPPI